jgi:hypothetical protein
MRVEKAGMEYRVDLHTKRKVQFECHSALTDDLEYLVWAKPFVI